MKTPLRILQVVALFLAFGFVPLARATEMVIIDGKYKQGTTSAPDPEYPIHAQHIGAAGQGIYRLVINTKTGGVEQAILASVAPVQVARTTVSDALATVT